MKSFPDEPASARGNNSPDEKQVHFIYHGSSMQPTFQSGQLLYVRPQAIDMVPGDVIVFPDPTGGDSQVVHRVISVTADGLITRGDNNLRNDAALVSPDKVIGRVEKAEFQKKTRHVAGGWRGLFWAWILRQILKTKRFFRRKLSKPYQWLKHSGMVPRIWHPKIDAIRFETPHGSLMKYMHNGKTVATHSLQDNRWHFRHPYDLILGPKSAELNEDRGR